MENYMEVNWAQLNLVRLNIEDAKKYGSDYRWKTFKRDISDLGVPQQYAALRLYLTQNEWSYKAKIQVTSYVNELEKNGLIQLVKSNGTQATQNNFKS
jgi:phage regulator Rha-like protein